MPLFRHIAASILLAAAIVAQEPGNLTFHAATTTVLVPFNVQRGKYFAADLQPSDFVLLEDGHPRQFTVFDGPNTQHPLPLEFILVFDTSKVAPKNAVGMLETVWNAKAEYEFLNTWDEATTRTVIQQRGMDVRVSIYHFDGHFERLCRSSDDPQEIGQAFRRLLSPIPTANQLALLANDRVVRGPGMLNLFSPGWWPEAAFAGLQDAATSPLAARRVMFIFSELENGNVRSWQAVADEAVALRIEIDPVVLDFYKLAEHMTDGRTGGHNAPGSAALGEMTGGKAFFPEHLNRTMLAQTLQRIRDTSFSKYLVGFVPDPSAKPGKHKLRVELKPETAGKMVGGEREGVVY